MTHETMSVQDWLNSLREAAGAPAEPVVRVRGAIRARGVRTRGGGQPPPAAGLAEVLEHLFAQPVPVRLEVVRELLRAPDRLAFALLRALALDSPDPDANVRWTIADGLGSIADPEAVHLLTELAQHDSDDTVRTCAIGALGERALQAYAVQVGPERGTPRELVRVRGAIRTRGPGPVRAVGPEAQMILDLLNRIRIEDASEYVKDKADLTLRQLGE